MHVYIILFFNGYNLATKQKNVVGTRRAVMWRSLAMVPISGPVIPLSRQSY